MNNRLLSVACLLLALNCSTHAGQWRGLVPLHSTRIDVLKLLPRSTIAGTHSSLHKLENEVALILYASGLPCGTNLANSWRVEKGTVINISVSPRGQIPFSSLRLDLKKYRKVVDPKATGDYYLISDEDGVRYHVQEQPGFVGGVLIETLYFPAQSATYLSCKRGQSGSDEKKDYPAFQTYGNISFDHEKSFLDNFAAYLLNDAPKLHAYVVAYSDRRISRRKARSRALRAKNYLVKVRGVPATRVTAAYGGIAEQFEVKLYALSSGLSPPNIQK